MSTTNNKNSSLRKTNILGISRLPETIDLIAIAKGCESFIGGVKAIRIAKPRDNVRNAFVEFISSRHCELAKETGKVTINNTSYELNYARSNNQPFNITASDDKLYVRYPADANENEIVKMLGDVRISKPENSKNFFFATCKDIEQQCQLVKMLDNKQLENGTLLVKIAIDKTRKRFPRRVEN